MARVWSRDRWPEGCKGCASASCACGDTGTWSEPSLLSQRLSEGSSRYQLLQRWTSTWNSLSEEASVAERLSTLRVEPVAERTGTPRKESVAEKTGTRALRGKNLAERAGTPRKEPVAEKTGSRALRGKNPAGRSGTPRKESVAERTGTRALRVEPVAEKTGSRAVRGKNPAERSGTPRKESVAERTGMRTLRGRSATERTGTLRESVTERASTLLGESSAESTGTLLGETEARRTWTLLGESAAERTGTLLGESSAERTGTLLGESAAERTGTLLGETEARRTWTLLGESAAERTGTLLGESAASEEREDKLLVFLCAGCRRPLSDSLSWVTSRKDTDCILLRSVSRNVSVDGEQVLSKREHEKRRERLNHQWERHQPVACSTHPSVLQALSCSGCSLGLGYVYRCTPTHLDHKRDLFCLQVDALESYVLGSAEKQILPQDEQIWSLESRNEIENSLKQMESVLKILEMKLWDLEAKLPAASSRD